MPFSPDELIHANLAQKLFRSVDKLIVTSSWTFISRVPLSHNGLLFWTAFLFEASAFFIQVKLFNNNNFDQLLWHTSFFNILFFTFFLDISFLNITWLGKNQIKTSPVSCDMFKIQLFRIKEVYLQSIAFIVQFRDQYQITSIVIVSSKTGSNISISRYFISDHISNKQFPKICYNCYIILNVPLIKVNNPIITIAGYI